MVANYTYNAWGEVLTATGNMASVNPLRYRGYYYDTETGFYYLQSRYYDPANHRFINADSQINTDKILGYNQFTYCNNNPIIYVDFLGTDAIILYDDQSFGHIGFLVQDKDGKWHHYYWGARCMAKSSGSSQAFFGGDTEPWEVMETYDGTEFDLSTINNYCSYGDTYDHSLYLVGDFSDVFSYIETGEQYHTFNNNCSQHSLRILAKCTTKYSKILYTASEKIRPKRSFKYLKKHINQDASKVVIPPVSSDIYFNTYK